MARRRPTDHTAPLWIESGTPQTTRLVRVAPLAPIDKVYTYTIDEALADRIRVGQRVSVPFGRKGTARPAIVVALTTGPWSSTLQSVKEILDPGGELSPHLLELGEWISRFYAAPLGRTLAAMVPMAVRSQRGFAALRMVRMAERAEPASADRIGKKQARILAALRAAGTPLPADALLLAAEASRATLRALIDKGLVIEEVTRDAPQIDPPHAIHDPDFELNDDQQAALRRVEAAIHAGSFRAILLFGVSGSGKTEVYIRAMRLVLAQGRQAIMLVPEIVLTTQLVQRLAVRFERVAVIHSGLSEVERSRAWASIRTGATPVVIGTRSAVFAPCPDPGIIVVDEEQESSYKNLQSPRFHVRDVAVKRAHLLGIPVMLGSATPSLESWHNVETHDTYERVDLPRRVRALPLPAVRLVDMRTEGVLTGAAALSRTLLRALEETLNHRRQAVILLNRRGFATILFCTQCGRRVECPQCQAGMVLHMTQRRMLCHHCHSAAPIPVQCADLACRGKLAHRGGGTERIERQLREAFPQARIQRADSDTMTHARKYQELVDAFAAGEIDVLLGTQMIAKGLDFPNVELVGVVGADLTSAGADFRASERLFQLVTQVAGRAGRADAAGRVLVQSQAPETPALRFAVAHDYAGFARAELASRRSFGMPPFTRLARFVLSGPADSTTSAEAEALAERLRTHVQAVAPDRASVLGPHPCLIERIRDKYRHEILLRAGDAVTLREILARARQAQAIKTRGAGVMVDVDPLNFT